MNIDEKIRLKLQEIDKNRQLRQKYNAKPIVPGEPIKAMSETDLKDMAKLYYEEEVLMAEFHILLDEKHPNKAILNNKAHWEKVISENKTKLDNLKNW